jgi:alpha-L-fucosidase 2
MKQHPGKYLFLLLVITADSLVLQAQGIQKLWYKQPAQYWTEALPLGNGRMGAMVFGKIQQESIQLNEGSLWSGGPVKTAINPEAPGYLPKIREALMEKEDYETAIALAKKMQGHFTESFLPMADLHIKQQFTDTSASAYYRDLNVSDAISTTKFTMDGTEFTRQVFISAPDQVMVLRISSSNAKKINLLLSASSLLHFTNFPVGKDAIKMKGKAPAHDDPSYHNINKEPVYYTDTTGCNGMRFEMVLKAISRDGNIQTDTAGIQISNASEVVILVTAATSFNGFDKCPDKEGLDEAAIAEQSMEKAVKKSYATLLKDHLDDYHKYFNRVNFQLKDTSSNNPNTALPSDERLQQYTKGIYDPGIETLYYNFGRYLLISCSRPGGTAANLQGIWNKELRPPWSSNFTININTQMNYWPAEMGNLSEMHAPLFELIKHLSVTGKRTAKEFYNMNGWVAHHNSDEWAASNPVGEKTGDPRWANWAQGGNWLCQHLWEHYQFTRDTGFLKATAYPLMKGAVTFCLDWLVKDKNGYWVVAPSVSPENVFQYANGKESDVSVASTMDMSIVWDLFTNTIESSEILGIDKEFRKLLIEKKNKLFPLHIGKKGNLQEWNKDWDDVEVHHRHVSHLFGLYPGRQIAPLQNPVMAAAAKKTLEIRGDEGTGWSKAWKINFWARLLDGNHAYLLVRDLLHATAEAGFKYSGGGGTYPNFFDAHPPFQIDGNFGGIAGMMEMLLQSHLNEIHLLPALPDAWKEGSVKGLKARGNFEIAINWKDGQLAKAEILSNAGGVCKIRTSRPINITGVKPVSVKTPDGFITQFVSKKGSRYFINAAGTK